MKKHAYPKHRYIDELGLYDEKRQLRDMAKNDDRCKFCPLTEFCTEHPERFFNTGDCWWMLKK